MSTRVPPRPIRRMLKACVDCGRPFQPAAARQRRCDLHEPHGRASRSPTTRAQDGEYDRNRKIVLAGHPVCALRIRCNGAPATTADHVVPVARGGSNAIANLQPACSPCNSSKQARIGVSSAHG